MANTEIVSPLTPEQLRHLKEFKEVCDQLDAQKIDNAMWQEECAKIYAKVNPVIAAQLESHWRDDLSTRSQYLNTALYKLRHEIDNMITQIVEERLANVVI